MRYVIFFARGLLILTVLFGAMPGTGQVVQVQPANPTSGDNIVLLVAAPQTGFVLQPVTVSGTQISITFRGGSAFPSGEGHQVLLPHLDPGVYQIILTYIFLDQGGNLDHVVILPPFSLQVLPGAHVPALDPRAMVLLVVTIATLGVVAVRRL